MMLDTIFNRRTEEIAANLNAMAGRGAEPREIRPQWPPHVHEQIEAFRAMVARSAWLNL